jgi:uncharacterized repeat protein (TIGR03803 family)
VLYRFTGGSDGAYPVGLLTRDSAGNLYGTTYQGGANNLGVAFELNAAGQETVLHSFAGGGDGAKPMTGLALDPSGDLFGTTSLGGAANVGVAFRISAAGQESVLHSFAPYSSGPPNSGVALDAAGNMYGTESVGFGLVYKVDTAGHYKVLYSFTGGADGFGPVGNLALDSAGNIYGVTIYGGLRNCGEGASCGVVYKLDPQGHETVLYSFTDGADGALPYGGVVLDNAGNLYGATESGGPTCGPDRACGGVYKLDAAGAFAVLYNFTGPAPSAELLPGGLALDAAGNIYGSTHYGGAANLGTVYELDPAGNFTLLHSFTGGADGIYPNSGLALDAAGNLYGASSGIESQAGTVYKVDRSGNFSVLYTFPCQSVCYYSPSGVTLDAAGNLYGATSGIDDRKGGNIVYRLDPAGNISTLYTFPGSYETDMQRSSLTLDSAGNLYGTTDVQARGRQGFLYKLEAPAAR